MPTTNNNKNSISFHPEWFNFFKSPEGIQNILSVVSSLGSPAAVRPTEKEQANLSSSELSYYMLKLDPRLQQFLPPADDQEAAFSYEDVVALLDITGRLDDKNTKLDLLFTAIACMAHGIVQVVSYYNSGTDQCDLQNTEIFVLKESYQNPNNFNKIPGADSKVFSLYNLDVDIFYENLNQDSGAGDSDIYENAMHVSLISPNGFSVENVLLDYYPMDLESEEEEN